MNHPVLTEQYCEIKKNVFIFKNKNFNFRINLLKQLKKNIICHRSEILSALKADFNKPIIETELTEIHTSIEEINFAIQNLKNWIEPVKVKTPVSLIGTESWIIPEPKGFALIISPWNYPFYLAISPLVSAIAAGCSVLIKPSEKTPQTSNIIKKIINEVFETNHVDVVIGDLEVSKQILDLKFDHIFFTGSTDVGKIVMQKASQFLTSVTLELGGKSPVIIDEGIDLKKSLKSILWGKMINSGQTCVAPDYLLVHQIYKDKLKMIFDEVLNEQIQLSNTKTNDLTSIIDQINFERLIDLMQNHKDVDCILDKDSKIIYPTLVELNNENLLQDDLMKAEIFGPLLPVIYFQNLDQAIQLINQQEKPLSLYMYSENNENINDVMLRTSSGSFVVNQVLLQLANPYLPFGGIGSSGIGSSHGYFGFKEFTHFKSVMKQSKFNLSFMLFRPYNSSRLKTILKFLKFLE